MFKKIYHLPQYICWQVDLRLPGEERENYNKWQPTIKQSLSEYIEYELQFGPDPFLKISRLIWGLIISVCCLTLLLSL